MNVIGENWKEMTERECAIFQNREDDFICSRALILSAENKQQTVRPSVAFK